MKTLNIAVSQSRVANPFGREVAKYLIIGDARDCAHIVSSADAEEWSSEYGYETVAIVNVDRPMIMAGSFEEIEADILSIIKEEAINEEICVTNEAGTLFIK